MSRRELEPQEKVIVAGVETVFWGIAGIAYPPAFLGMIVTIEEIARHGIIPSVKEWLEKPAEELDSDDDDGDGWGFSFDPPHKV